ncbi:hypothetical protein YC2023_082960 [Brassica napus]
MQTEIYITGKYSPKRRSLDIWMAMKVTKTGFKVTHLGVVGRRVKRVLMNATSTESSPSQKLALILQTK